MADQEDVEEQETADTEADGLPPVPRRRRLSGRRLVLFVIAPLVVLGAGGAGAHYAGLFEPSGEQAEAEAPPRPKVFYEMPELVVNLASHGEQRRQYLKLQVSLELPDKAARDALVPVLPRIVDLFQIYLRELRTSDLDGSAGIYRLKEELERRINVEIHPHEVSDVLFEEIVIQ